MEFRQRVVVGTIWIAVALLLASTLEPAVPSSAGDVARLFVVVLSLFLAGVYLLNPRDVVSRKPF